MKLYITRANLLAGLSAACEVVDKSPINPSMKYVAINAKADGNVRFSATNLAATVVATSPAIEVKKAGAVGLNGHDLLTRIKATSSEDVTILVGNDGDTTITAGKVRFHMKSWPADDMPKTEIAVSPTTVELSGAVFARGIGAAAPYACQTMGYAMANYVRIRTEGGRLLFIATDGARAVVLDAGATDLKALEIDLPLSAAKLFGRLAAGADTIRLGLTASAITLDTGSVLVEARKHQTPMVPQDTMASMLAGHVPDAKVEIDRAETSAHLKALLAGGEEAVILVSEDGKLILRSPGADSSGYVDTGVLFSRAGEAKATGPYLLNALSLFEAPEVELSFGESLARDKDGNVVAANMMMTAADTSTCVYVLGRS